MNRPLRSRLAVVPLEDRCTPATASLSAGVLTVTGTAAGDRITVRQSAGRYAVDGVGTTFAAAAVTRISVDAQGGDDVVSLAGVGVPALVWGGNGNDMITGGAAADQIVAGNGNDVVDGGAGPDRVAGDAGDDTLRGGAGDDTLFGGSGNDTVFGGDGDDFLSGMAGRDGLYGDNGVDRYFDDYVKPATSDFKAALATKKAGEPALAVAADIRQQSANTCSFLAALATAANAGTDLLARVSYDPVAGTYSIPVSFGGTVIRQSIGFDGVWTDNDPLPQLGDDGRRDYWVALYQRAYLKAYNVDTTNPDWQKWSVRGKPASQVTGQSWRYPFVALEAVTGRQSTAYAGRSAAGRAAVESALRSGRPVVANTHTQATNQPLVAGTGLVFSHTYAVVASDASGVTLRNPWGVDALSSNMAGFDAAKRSAFTLGNEGDGLVRVTWEAFQRAFATVVVG